MLEVLFGGLCGDISFGSVRTGSVLEVQEGYKASVIALLLCPFSRLLLV
jgi:hypothetical protein